MDAILIPIIFVSSIPIIAIGYPFAKAYAKRLERESLPSSVPSDVAHRLERMEQAIDSIAVEVERISEGQRFATKLLAERVAPAAPASLPRRE